MHLCEELQLGVCATADGGAALFNLENGQFFAGLMLFQAAARSASVVKHNDGARYSVLCGGMDGVIHQIPLNIDPESKRVDEDNPFLITDDTDTAIKPKHTGPVMCLASRDDGMFVSGGQDGTLRVWDCGTEEPEGDGERQTDPPTPRTRCMYALTGYKLWLGSACTDGLRLVSDGESLVFGFRAAWAVLFVVLYSRGKCPSFYTTYRLRRRRELGHHPGLL